MVFLDLSMPGMSGMDVLCKIREIDSNAGVVVLSAFGDVDVFHEAMQAGANFYTQKPVELDSLLKILTAWQKAHERGL
jgi:FixJ family two-component response regulator